MNNKFIQINFFSILLLLSFLFIQNSYSQTKNTSFKNIKTYIQQFSSKKCNVPQGIKLDKIILKAISQAKKKNTTSEKNIVNSQYLKKLGIDSGVAELTALRIALEFTPKNIFYTKNKTFFVHIPTVEDSAKVYKTLNCSGELTVKVTLTSTEASISYK